MTHEFLALMLCVHRPGVTVAARLFQQAGLVRYGNGRIAITDRPASRAPRASATAPSGGASGSLLGSAKG